MLEHTIQTLLQLGDITYQTIDELLSLGLKGGFLIVVFLLIKAGWDFIFKRKK